MAAMRAWSLSFAVVAALAACGDDPRPPAAIVVQGELEVRVWDAPARIAVLRGGEVLWETLPGADGGRGFVATRATAPSLPGVPAGVEMRFGAFRFGVDADTAWSATAELTALQIGADRVDFGLVDRRGQALGQGHLIVTADGGGGAVSLDLDLAPAAGNRVALGWGCAPDEHYLGLGGQSWAIDHRGQTVPMWSTTASGR
jgi:hypothetical protein